MYNEEKVIESISIIQNTCFTDLNPYETILVISNLILAESVKYFPSEIEKDALKIISNGKRINYELLKYEDNFGLNLALKAHLMVADMQNQVDGNNV